MLKNQTRRKILAAGIIIPLMLGVSACSEPSIQTPTSTPSTTPSAIAGVEVEDATDSPAAADMYEAYLNKLYTIQALDIQAVATPFVADGELSADDTTALVKALKITYPELFGAFDLEGLTDDDAAKLFYSLSYLAQTLNDEKITATITVPDSAILIKGNTATVDAEQVVAESEGNVLTLGDDPVEVNLIKKNNQWFIVPPANMVSPDATTEVKE